MDSTRGVVSIRQRESVGLAVSVRCELTVATSNEQATRELGRALGVACWGPLCVALRGPLGAGKTVVVKGMAEGLGMAETVTSPTFTFVNEYQGGGRRLTHADLYRIESYEDLESIGWSDLVPEADVLAVEWAERADGELPTPRIDVALVLGAGDERRVEVHAVGAEAQAALARLQTQGLDFA